MVPNFTLFTNCKAKLWYKYIYLGKKTQIAWIFTKSDSGKRFYINFSFVSKGINFYGIFLL